ncbi:uncharacterized protein LOC62_05G006720 [Vanrija pseudolonga]|uniref:Uncharacterized protein n=1 Tax=Vanrija pseudolonga TaxID=143232 RepID=A0AAF0YB29_9TREE|nr:hypothetical protein LOC62_05G006720 [Vanrija pseudolonga]
MPNGSTHIVIESTPHTYLVQRQHSAVSGAWPTSADADPTLTLAPIFPALRSAAIIDLRGVFPPAANALWAVPQTAHTLRVFANNALVPSGVAGTTVLFLYFTAQQAIDDVDDAFAASLAGCALASKVVVNVAFDPALDFWLDGLDVEGVRMAWDMGFGAREVVVVFTSTMPPPDEAERQERRPRGGDTDGMYLFTIFLLLLAKSAGEGRRLVVVGIDDVPAPYAGFVGGAGGAEARARAVIAAALGEEGADAAVEFVSRGEYAAGVRDEVFALETGE